MYDGGTGTSSNNLLWYQIGRSSGHSDAESDSARKVRGLISDINALQNQVRRLQADLNVVVPNRDDLAKQAWDLHYQLEDANQGIAILKKGIDEAWQMYDEQQASSNQAIEQCRALLNLEINRCERYQGFAMAVIGAANILLRAAEAGKSNRQDYIDLKAMYDHMTDLWSREKLDARDDPEFTQKAMALMESLIK